MFEEKTNLTDKVLIKTAMKRLLIILFTLFALTSCYEKKSNDALKTYKYWAGTKPPDELQLIDGKYLQSAHWTKEYIMYLKFKPTKLWWDEFLKQNNISEDKSDWTMPSDAPNWFNPSETSVRYGGNTDFDQGSRYFRDTITRICYLYEIQL